MYKSTMLGISFTHSKKIGRKENLVVLPVIGFFPLMKLSENISKKCRLKKLELSFEDYKKKNRKFEKSQLFVGVHPI